MSVRKGLGALIVAVGLWTTIAPRATGATSEQVWLDVNPSWWVSEHVEVFGDLGYRFEPGDNDWRRVVIRPGVGIPYKKVRFTAGVGNFLTFDEVFPDRWELRFFQGVFTTWPHWERFSVDHYLRLEERFDFNLNSWRVLSSLRLRYQLGCTYRLAKPRPTRPDSPWAIVGMAEGFLTLAGQEGIQQEQARVTVGVQHDLGNNHRLRFECSWQQETVFFRVNEPVNEFLFRVRWFL